jgi:hypothetical protein
MFKFSTSTLSIGKIWENSFALYKQTILKVWYIPFTAALLLRLGSLWFKNILPQLPPLLISLYLLAVALHYIFALAAEPASKISNSLRVVLTKILHIFAACLIFFLLFFIVYFMASFLPSFIIGIFAVQTMTTVTIIAITFTAAFVAAIMYAGIFCLFTVPNILFANKNFFKAIMHSLHLVRGNWWRTFAIMLLPMIPTYIVLLLLQKFVTNGLLNILFGSLCMGLLLPLVTSVVLVQFNDLNRR